jgi:hypothetical protein
MTMTPELALAYLKELSADYRAGVVLDADQRPLAGDRRLALELPLGEHEGETANGKVFALRTDSHTIVVTTGPFALPSVARQDLRNVLAAMGAASAQETSVQRIPHGSVEALLGGAN